MVGYCLTFRLSLNIKQFHCEMIYSCLPKGLKMMRLWLEISTVDMTN